MSLRLPRFTPEFSIGIKIKNYISDTGGGAVSNAHSRQQASPEEFPADERNDEEEGSERGFHHFA